MRRMGEKIEEAVELACDYGVLEGEDHKQWIIDQMLRILLGAEYGVRIERLGVPWNIGKQSPKPIQRCVHGTNPPEACGHCERQKENRDALHR